MQFIFYEMCPGASRYTGCPVWLHRHSENGALSSHSKEDLKYAFKSNNSLMQAKSMQNALVEHSTIVSTCTNLSSVSTIFVLFILEWLHA